MFDNSSIVKSMMVSTRGVKFKFTEGERVLCYEPDPTKAKVLYESKVLQLVVSRDSRGRKIPEYLVHFYGWNSSWDRCVAEDFVLPDNDENRNLQKRLSREAAIQLKGKKKHKLTSLLKGSYNPCKKANIETERQEAFEAQIENDQSRKDYDSSIDENEEDEDDQENDDEKVEDGDEGDDDDEDDDEEEMEEDEEDTEVTVTIPDVLKEKLEDDCFMITCKNKLVGLPCEPNVVSILEGYVKHVAVSMVCTAPLKGTRQQFTSQQMFSSDVETKIQLCKEVVDGLRIYFDFCLPALLLYRQEKLQYNGIGSIKISAAPVAAKVNKSNENSVHKVKVEAPVAVIDEPQESLPSSPVPSAPTSPRTTRQSRARPTSPSPTKAAVQHYRKGSQSPTSSGEESQSIRRILRSTDKSKLTNELKVETTTPNEHLEIEPPCSASPESPTLPQKILRHTLKSLSPSSSTEPQKTVAPSQPSRTVQSPPPATPLTNATNQTSVSSVGSSASSTHSSAASSGEGAANNSRDTSGLLNEILSWQMLPVHLYEQVPPLPSMVYGAHHLLRLFVKLPALVQKMNIPKIKQDHLQKELDNFLRYLQEKHEELLLDSVYINNDQTSFIF